MNKRTLAFCICCSENIIFSAANVALSLNKYMPNEEFDIVIFHNGLSANNLQALEKIPRCSIRMLSFPDNFQKNIMEKLPNGRWKNPNSILCFAKFEVFDLLYEYQTVIWLDADVAIQSSIVELRKFGPFAQAKDVNCNTISSVRDQFCRCWQLDKMYNMDADAYLDALIVVNDRLPQWRELREYCYEKALEYAEHLVNPTQAVFALMLQDFKISVMEIPGFDYICHAQHEFASLAKVVHFGGLNKVWNDFRLFRAYPEWFRTHLNWIELGGGDFDRSWVSTRSLWAELYGNISHCCADIDVNVERKLNSNFVRPVRSTFYLFGVLPLFDWYSSFSEVRLKCLGVPFFRFCRQWDSGKLFVINYLEICKWKEDSRNGKITFYILGVPCLKILKK